MPFSSDAHEDDAEADVVGEKQDEAAERDLPPLPHWFCLVEVVEVPADFLAGPGDPGSDFPPPPPPPPPPLFAPLGETFRRSALQRILMLFSVRPGRRAAMRLHLLPSSACVSMMIWSSFSVYAPLLMAGFRWWHQRSRHCLLVLPVCCLRVLVEPRRA